MSKKATEELIIKFEEQLKHNRDKLKLNPNNVLFKRISQSIEKHINELKEQIK